MTSSAGDSPNPAIRRPPTIPPNGISAKHIAVVREVTRPTSGAGIRSKITAPRIGLMKPAAKPPATHTASTAQIGTSRAKTTYRGAPQTRKAIR
ncbi:hypothetical protein GCM10023146_25600 [Nocardioides caricicola]